MYYYIIQNKSKLVTGKETGELLLYSKLHGFMLFQGHNEVLTVQSKQNNISLFIQPRVTPVRRFSSVAQTKKRYLKFHSVCWVANVLQIFSIFYCVLQKKVIRIWKEGGQMIKECSFWGKLSIWLSRCAHNMPYLCSLFLLPCMSVCLIK